MPALAEKTVDRASKLAPDVAEGPSGPDLEAPTEDEDLMGNAASVEAMMEAEPDEPGDDGGGVLAAMMAAEEEATAAEAPPEAEARPEQDAGALPEVGLGTVEDGVVKDCHGTPVEVGLHVVHRDQVWEVKKLYVEEDGQFTLVLEHYGKCTIHDFMAFAVTDQPLSEKPADQRLAPTRSTPEAAGPLAAQTGPVAPRSGGGLSFADSAAKQGTVLDIKVRRHTDDVYKERGIADAEKGTGTDRFKRWAIPRKMRAKLWSDAKEEFDGLEGAEVAKQAPKYRKMMVRAVERLDDYALQVDTAHALTEAHFEQDYKNLIEAEKDGDAEAIEMYRNAMATLRDYRDGLAEKSPRLHSTADTTHERSQEVVRWSDEVELIGTSPAAARMRGEEIAARADQYRDWVDVAFRDRIEGKRYANDAHGITRAIRDDAIYGKRAKGYMKRKARRGRKDVQGAGKTAAGRIRRAPMIAASMATGGMIGLEEREVDGGASTKVAVDFNTWKTNFDKVKAECALIEADALYGSHTGLYTTLKMLAEFGIPTLQGVLKALMVWGTVLGMASLGAGLALSAAAGTVLLVVTALKAALELVLALWSVKKVEDYTDRDARKKRHAKAERFRHGKAFAADAASVAAYGSLATRASGKTMSPDKAWTERFDDVGNSDERHDGGVSTAKARKGMGIPKEERLGMDGVGHTTAETPESAGFARRAAHKVTDTTIDRTAKGLELGGRQADEEREHRIDPTIDHSAVQGLSADDRFFSASLAGPAPRGKAPEPPGAPASGPAPDFAAPAPPDRDLEVETPAEDAPEASSDQAATEGSKVKRMASKVASGLARASEKADEVAPRSDDEEAEDKAAAVAQIAEDADVVAEALP